MRFMRVATAVFAVSGVLGLCLALSLSEPAKAVEDCNYNCPQVYCVSFPHCDLIGNLDYKTYKKYAWHSDVECVGPFTCGYTPIGCVSDCAEYPPPEG